MGKKREGKDCVMDVRVVREKSTGGERRMVRRVGVEARLQADRIVLCFRSAQTRYWHEGRLLIHPIGGVHNQRAFRRGHLNASPTLFLLQHCYTTKMFRISLFHIATEAECVINARTTTTVYFVNGGSECMERGEVQQGVVHSVGSFIRDLVMMEALILHHVLSI